MSAIALVALVLVCCIGIPAAIYISSRWGGKKKQRKVESSITCGGDTGSGKDNFGGVNMAEKTIKLNIGGMTCQGCANTVARYLKREKGVAEVSVDWKAGSGVVVIAPEVTSEEDIIRNRVFEGHYSAELSEQTIRSDIQDTAVLDGHS